MAQQFEITNKTVHSIHQDSQTTLEVSPDWQRSLVWNADKRQELIVSILKKIPMPSIYTHSNDSTGKEQVIDGKQRLTTIFDFLTGKLTIKNKYITDNQLTGLFECTDNPPREYTFQMLSTPEKNKFKNYKVAINILKGNWSDGDRFDITNRIQKGVNHTNGENLYSRRQNVPIINQMIVIYDEKFTIENDTRKHYFNVLCKMFYIFRDEMRIRKPVTNCKVNKFFSQYSHISDTDSLKSETTFLQVLKDFLTTFAEYRNFDGPSGYLTLFAIWLLVYFNSQQTLEIFKLTQLENEKLERKTMHPYQINRQLVDDVKNGRKQTTLNKYWKSAVE